MHRNLCAPFSTASSNLVPKNLSNKRCSLSRTVAQISIATPLHDINIMLHRRPFSTRRKERWRGHTQKVRIDCDNNKRKTVKCGRVLFQRSHAEESHAKRRDAVTQKSDWPPEKDIGEVTTECLFLQGRNTASLVVFARLKTSMNIMLRCKQYTWVSPMLWMDTCIVQQQTERTVSMTRLGWTRW
jgi:hypothetical protein